MKRENTHNFLLVLSGVDENTNGLADALYRAGCDDALISYKNGIVCLNFDRAANTLRDAISSAISDIENVDINVKINHIDGIFVTLSEIANRTKFTKQAISLFIKGKRGSGNFPVPFSGVGSTSPIWRWKEVATWLVENEKIENNNVIENAELLDNFNSELEKRNNCSYKNNSV